MKKAISLFIALITSALVLGQVKVINTVKLYDSPSTNRITGKTCYKDAVLEIGSQIGDFWEIYRNSKRIGYLHKSDLKSLMPMDATLIIDDGTIIRDIEELHQIGAVPVNAPSTVKKFRGIGLLIQQAGEYQLNSMTIAFTGALAGILLKIAALPSYGLIVAITAVLVATGYHIVGIVKLKRAGSALIRYSPDL